MKTRIALAVAALATGLALAPMPAQAAPQDLPACVFLDGPNGNVVNYPTGYPQSVPCYYSFQYSNGPVVSAWYDKNGKWHADTKNSTK